MAGEAVASPMRLATAPGRSARPAPSGNDDPCEERRTIPEGLPRLPREAITKWSQTGGSDAGRRFGEDRQRTTASTGPGQKSHVERRKGERTRRRVTQDASPPIGLAGPMCGVSNAARGNLGCAMNARRAFARACRSMRRLPAGHGGPIGVRRKHPSATGAPHAPREGARKMEGKRKKGEAR